MEKTFEELWSKFHAQYKGEIRYDNWLDKWLKHIDKQDKILELGCGLGNNVKYLRERGYNLIATDLSPVALEQIKQNFPEVEVESLDLTKKFPFKDNSFDFIIADLCLHYFSEKMTKQVMSEIARVLKNGGKLFARVNSIEDIFHGAGQGKKLEENFYFVEGYNKRFFDDEAVIKFFGIIGNVEFNSAIMKRYDKEKNLIEICVTCAK